LKIAIIYPNKSSLSEASHKLLSIMDFDEHIHPERACQILE